MADVNGLISEIERTNTLLKQQSMHDALTVLLNRRAFDEALSHYVGLAERGVMSRLVMLDLFKQVNDRYGHSVGDELLRVFADTLRERCRSADVLARIGGDEFAVIMPGDSSDDIAQWLGDMNRRFSIKQRALNNGEGIEPECHISAGAVLIEKGGQEDEKSLMLKADKRMYEVKIIGRMSFRKSAQNM